MFISDFRRKVISNEVGCKERDDSIRHSQGVFDWEAVPKSHHHRCWQVQSFCIQNTKIFTLGGP